MQYFARRMLNHSLIFGMTILVGCGGVVGIPQSNPSMPTAQSLARNKIPTTPAIGQSSLLKLKNANALNPNSIVPVCASLDCPPPFTFPNCDPTSSQCSACFAGGTVRAFCGTQAACLTGFILVSPGCENNTLAFGLNFPDIGDVYNKYVLENVYVIRFNDPHFWARHLACYLHSSNAQFDDVVAHYFDTAIWSTANEPSEGSQADFKYTFNENGRFVTVVFRLFVVNKNYYYNVTTALIVGNKNCPGF